MALYSDSYRVWGRNIISELINEKLEPRLALGLLSTLGDDSAYYASRAGGMHFLGWTYDRYMRKLTLEVQQYTTYILRKAHGDNKAQVPERLPAPGDEAQARKKGQEMFRKLATQALKAAKG